MYSDQDFFFLQTRPGVLQNGLYIVNAQFIHQGYYECQAVTVMDTASRRAYVTVRGTLPVCLFVCCLVVCVCACVCVDSVIQMLSSSIKVIMDTACIKKSL